MDSVGFTLVELKRATTRPISKKTHSYEVEEYGLFHGRHEILYLSIYKMRQWFNKDMSMTSGNTYAVRLLNSLNWRIITHDEFIELRTEWIEYHG